MYVSKLKKKNRFMIQDITYPELQTRGQTVDLDEAAHPQHLDTYPLLPNTLKCLSIGTPKIINFPFVSNGNLMILGVPIFKQIIMGLYSA